MSVQLVNPFGTKYAASILVYRNQLYLFTLDICFGHNVHTKPEIILNRLILVAKFYIHQCKIAALIPNMTGYVNTIRHTLKVQKGIALKQDKLDPFIKKWKNLLFLDC